MKLVPKYLKGSSGGPVLDNQKQYYLGIVIYSVATQNRLGKLLTPNPACFYLQIFDSAMQ